MNSRKKITCYLCQISNFRDLEKAFLFRLILYKTSGKSKIDHFYDYWYFQRNKTILLPLQNKYIVTTLNKEHFMAFITFKLTFYHKWNTVDCIYDKKDCKEDHNIMIRSISLY